MMVNIKAQHRGPQSERQSTFTHPLLNLPKLFCFTLPTLSINSSSSICSTSSKAFLSNFSLFLRASCFVLDSSHPKYPFLRRSFLRRRRLRIGQSSVLLRKEGSSYLTHPIRNT